MKPEKGANPFFEFDLCCACFNRACAEYHKFSYDPKNSDYWYESAAYWAGKVLQYYATYKASQF